MSAPGYWMDETSGVLKPAVIAFLQEDDMTPEQIAAMRAYFRQWMAGDWRGEDIDSLRATIDGLTSVAALREWVRIAEAAGIDPL